VESYELNSVSLAGGERRLPYGEYGIKQSPEMIRRVQRAYTSRDGRSYAAVRSASEQWRMDGLRKWRSCITRGDSNSYTDLQRPGSIQ